MDYIEGILEEFVELHGDRMGHDDPAVIAGLGRLEGIPLVVLGHEKGRTLAERTQRNFGMPHPEGNRKALRMLAMAERFSRPVLALVDTPGAYAGVAAEARGQASAIAENLLAWAKLQVPTVAAIIGEGGSGGALALAMADRVLMMEHSVYSVISPEGCAAILWRDEGKKAQAAEALRLSAQDALAAGLIHETIAEPPGGAHRDPVSAKESLKEACVRQLEGLLSLSPDALVAQRYERYRGMGVIGVEDKGGGK
jgi:acetyl-CoA carboxylase carboxyl transferase subunit alpha